MHGDEFQSWITTSSGHTVIRNRGDNHWEHAQKGEDGKLKPTGIRVREGVAAPSHLVKGVRPSRNEAAFRSRGEFLRKKLQKRRKQVDSETTLSSAIFAAPTAGTTSAANASYAPIYFAPGQPSKWPAQPITGTAKLLVIRVNFNNRSMITSASAMNKAVFNTSAGVLSIANYYKDNSFGNFAISPASHSQPGFPAGIMGVYTFYDHPYYTNDYSWVEEVLWSASQYINFSDFDSDHDGVVSSDELAVHFILAGYEESTGTYRYPSVWAHYDPAMIDLPGIKIYGYSVTGELSGSSTLMPIGVMAHELGHNILGLPDLYDTSGYINNYGVFSLMASGSWGSNSISSADGSVPVSLDAWSRQYVGWATPRLPESGATISFKPALSAVDSPVKMIDTAKSSSEYFLAENRYPTGWDRGLYRWLGSDWKGGLLITHVDEGVGTPGNNDINRYDTSPGHVGIMVEEAYDGNCSMFDSFWPYCWGDRRKLFYKGNNAAFGIHTTPDSSYTDFTPSDLGLYMISSPGSPMTAYYHKGDFLEPAAMVTGTPSTPIKAGTFLLTVEGEDLAAYKWRVTKGTAIGTWSYVTPVSNKISVAATTAGYYKVEVVGKDVAGNWQSNDGATAVDWTVDTTAPLTTLGDKPALRSNITSPDFTFSSEDGATFECKVDTGAYAVCASPFIVQESLKDGRHAFTVRAKDVAGNYDATPATYSWTVDTVPPTLAIKAVTPTNKGTKVITGTKEAGSTVTVTWPNGEVYPTTYVDATSWSYTATGYALNDQTVLTFTATDVAFNSTTATATIIHDNVAPSGTIMIKGTESTDSWTNKTAVTLNLTCDGTGSDCSQVCLSNTPTCTAWVSYADTQGWTVTTGNGAKTVYAKFKDKAGNPSSIQYSDTVLLDSTAPTGKVTINNGSARTKDRLVSISFTATDNIGGSGVADMRYATTSSFAGADWQPYAPTGEIPLAGIDGTKTVHAQFRDTAGKLSAVVYDTITLDTTPPALTINTVTPTTTTTKFIAGTKAQGSTITTLTVPDGVTYTLNTAATSTATTTWSCTLNNLATGTNRITVTATDLAGNTTDKAASIICLANALSGWTASGLSGKNISALTMSPADPDTLYSGTFDGIIYKTIDGGATWDQIFLEAVHPYAIAINPKNPDVIYVATGHAGPLEENPTSGGIYKTIDGGATWNQVLTNVYVYSMQLDPVNPDKILVGSKGSGIYRSVDAGANWTNYTTGLPTQSATLEDILDIRFDKVNPLIAYIATYNGGVYKTTNGGTTWVATGLKHGPLLRLAIAPSNRAVIYAGGKGPDPYQVSDGLIHLYKSSDSAVTWKSLTIPIVGTNDTPFTYGLAANPKNLLEAYVAISGWGVFKTIDGGSNWKEVNTGISTGVGDGGLVIHPEAPQIMYLATYNGVFKTMKGGE